MSSGYRSYVSQSGNKPIIRRGRAGGGDLFFPFFFIVAGFIILILLYQFVATWIDQQATDIADKMIVKVESGGAVITPWGEREKLVLHDGGAVLEGDKVDLAQGGTIVLSLADGTSLRFGDGAAFSIDKKEDEVIELSLNQGRVWFYPVANSNLNSVIVTGENSFVTTDGRAEFDYASLDEDAVRLIDGSAEIHALSEKQEIGSFTVGVGQQIVLTNDVLVEIKNGKELNLLKGIADSYREKAWYQLNIKSDPRLAKVVNAASVVLESPAVKPIGSEGAVVENKSDEQTSQPMEEKAVSNVPKPLINKPNAEINVSEQQYTIEGTVEKTIAKVRVDHNYEGRQLSSIVLSKYQPGSGLWKYTAVGGDDSNMRQGGNVYEVIAIDSNDVESEKAEIKINYYPQGIPEEIVNLSLAKASPEPLSITKVTGEPTPKAGFKLAAPQVISFNDGSEPITKDVNVKVVGQVDPASVRVFVNGFALTGYRGGEKQWVYYAAEKYGTLTTGNNTYRVYSVDGDGNKSPVTEFTITKESD